MIFIASLTGIWAIPAFLSIHSSLSLAAVSACSFSRKSFCGSLGCPGTPCSRGSGGMRASLLCATREGGGGASEEAARLEVKRKTKMQRSEERRVGKESKERRAR